ncbi:hypothetical protein CYY_007779 [Polysphondylium violaceum]|uniref:4'-phosphopantetheinyl transferase domain-containing protein n=1 Tax=Polysphondylium violaceum TaxID=133409 RepID=A0A8J4PQA2_9MYCE|nr:hypothetical protein CYY_007779 [Polysphondylium violaceum]
MTSRIYGIGNDIVKVSRLKSSFERHGDKFLKRAFHDDEIVVFKQIFNENNDRAFQFLGGRWAAKESIYKALGNQERSKLNFQNIRIFNHTNGKPYVDLLDPTNQYFRELGIDTIHLAISHEDEYAISNVILETTLDKLDK